MSSIHRLLYTPFPGLPIREERNCSVIARIRRRRSNPIEPPRPRDWFASRNGGASVRSQGLQRAAYAFPLPLGEGQGEGERVTFPLTLVLSPKGRGEQAVIARTRRGRGNPIELPPLRDCFAPRRGTRNHVLRLCCGGAYRVLSGHTDGGPSARPDTARKSRVQVWQMGFGVFGSRRT